MRRAITFFGLALAIVTGGILAFTSPPRLLSVYDWAAGGGAGAQQVAKGVEFGSHRQTLDVWAPEGTAKSTLPVVIFWYGGGWAKGDRAAYAFAGRALANAGFVVVIPDYRKVPQVRFPAFLEDGAEAVRWTRDNIGKHDGDPDRIAFMGHSAGAYQAVMLALDTKWLTAAGIDPGIGKAAVGLSGPYDFYPFDSPRSIAAFGQWPRPLETQPIAYASKDAPPLLLVTSENDTTVRSKNANNLATKLRALGASVEVENYGPIDHEEVVMALSKPFRSKGPVLADSAAFLHSHLAAGEE